MSLPTDVSRISEALAVAALEASGVVGSWEWDHARHEAIYDRGAASLLAGDAELAGRQLHRSQATLCIHPADVENLVAQTIQAVRFGGLYIAEYRVIRADGSVRWLLSRGKTFLGDAGRPTFSRGILIDITESREPSESYVTHAGWSHANEVHIAADHVIAAREILKSCKDFSIRKNLDAALFSIGKIIANNIKISRLNRH